MVIVLSSGGATVLEGILGTTLGRFNGSFGGGFLPRIFLFCISTLDWIRSLRRLLVLVMFFGLIESLVKESWKERIVPSGAGVTCSEMNLLASNVRLLFRAVSAVS